MSMDKTMLCTGDYFVLTVANDEDAPLCICIAAVLDYWLYNKKTKTSDDFGLDFDPLTDYENNEAKVIDFSFVIFTLLLHMIVQVTTNSHCCDIFKAFACV